MTNGLPQSRIGRVILVLTCLATTIAITACTSNKSKAKALIAEQMTGQGVTDISIDVFLTSNKYPDRAYTSATITYNFASSDGKPQREFLGFILSRAGSGWRIEKSARYTSEESQAEQYLSSNDSK